MQAHLLQLFGCGLSFLQAVQCSSQHADFHLHNTAAAHTLPTPESSSLLSTCACGVCRCSRQLSLWGCEAAAQLACAHAPCMHSTLTSMYSGCARHVCLVAARSCASACMTRDRRRFGTGPTCNAHTHELESCSAAPTPHLTFLLQHGNYVHDDPP